jgi:hypothetical protein
MEKRHLRNLWTKIGAGVLALIALVVSSYVTWQPGRVDSVPETATSDSQTRPANTSNADSPTHDTPPLSDPQIESTPRDVENGNQADPAATSTRFELTLVDRGGKEVAQILVRIGVLDVRARIRGTSEPESEQELRSDSSGRISFDLPEHTWARLQILDAAWRVRAGQDGYRDNEPGQRPELLLARPADVSGECRREVIIEELTQLTVEVSYADGLPFTGKVTCRFAYMVESKGKLVERGSVASSLDVDSAYSCLFEAVPTDANSLMIITRTDREGYEGTYRTTIQPWDNAPVATVIVPVASELDKTRIVVKLTKLSEETRVRVRIWNEYGAQFTNCKVNGGQTVRTAPLIQGVRHTVMVMGEQTWIVRDVVLARGETKEFEPELEQPATLTAILVDEDDRPLSPAVMNLMVEEIFGWTGLKGKARLAAEHGYALTNESGLVSLNVPPGAGEVLVEAPKRDRLLLKYTAKSGEAVDLGRVVIPIATGRIVVYQNESGATEASLYQLGTSRVAGPQSFDSDGKAIFEGLQRNRTYLVCVETPAKDTMATCGCHYCG